MTTESINESAALEILRRVIDPELDCNIVDLGLVYGVAISGPKVTVTLTLTTAGCPMHESIAWGVQSALLDVKGVEEVDVRLTWDPPWSPARMSEYARAKLGITI